MIKFTYNPSDLLSIDNKPLYHDLLQPLYHDLLHGEKFMNNHLGFIDLPSNHNKKEFTKVKETAENIKINTDVFIVIGIGGSYIGAKACIEALSHNFYNSLHNEARNGPEIYYLGNNLSSSYILDLFDMIGDKSVTINVISKSGETTEPAIAFRLAKEYMAARYSKEELKDRIIITTDKEKGSLKKLADIEGYKSFVIPDNIGGRFSVLTPVGLLPMAVAGINIDNIMNGAKSGQDEYSLNNDSNVAYKYAIIRNILYQQGKSLEVLANYEPSLSSLGEWWKQLFGESEGKDGKGLFPSTANFTTDLHSMGQYIQDGKRNLFVTTINIESFDRDIIMKSTKDNLDNLNYMSSMTVNHINKQAFEGTRQAHIAGGVPNLTISLPSLNDFYLGKLIYFFQVACSMSGLILGVNPFNQPGVETYKENMFSLLGKPQYKD